MAKSNLSWQLDKEKMVLIVEILAINKKVSFKLSSLFEKIGTFEEVQIMVIANGVKQKLGDALARAKDVKLTPEEMVTTLEEVWRRLAVDKKWNVEGKGLRGGKIKSAWDRANPNERTILEKLGLKPKDV